MEMRAVPAVGAGRGVFELFVPGLFLLLNLVGIAYYTPPLKEHWQSAVAFAGGSPVAAAAIATAIAICFGYLLGVLLRLPQVEPVDQVSAAWLRSLHAEAKTKVEDSEGKTREEVAPWAEDHFPYIRWLKKAYGTESTSPSGATYGPRLSPEAVRFFDLTWAPRRQETHNKQFSNLCRILVTSKNPALAAELYANESLCRYVSGTFYALLVATGLALCLLVHLTPWGQLVPSPQRWWMLAAYLAVAAVIFRVPRNVGVGGITGIRPAFLLLSTEIALVRLLNSASTHEFPLAWGLLVYVAAVFLILRNFRFLRIKEAEAVFASCFAYNNKLEPLLTDPRGLHGESGAPVATSVERSRDRGSQEAGSRSDGPAL